MINYTMHNCKITSGFFAQKQQINAENTIPNVYARFTETGRFKALKCKNEEPHSHIYWDSDVAKWLEAAAYLLSRKDDKQIRAWYDEAVEDILANQLENGYFNSHFQVYEPDQIFTRRHDHELYCAGHFFEAAVAASEYLHDDRLLRFAEKYVDYIFERFVIKQDTAFISSGHQEIEIALLRLYEYTKQEKYKDLAMFFLNNRGKDHDEHDIHTQSFAPVREQSKAQGHAVRAHYLYTAMAQAAYLTGDRDLRVACEKLFDDVVQKKMYVTGGTGSSYTGERFSSAYDLPNEHAYAETCASIGLVFFAHQMFRLTGEAKYAHVLERALYNGVSSGVSLDGTSFFYTNPLEVSKERLLYNASLPAFREPSPILQRVKVFYCSCCPPNICRFFEEINSYIWYANEEKNELVLSQYISSNLTSPVANVRLDSGLPTDGKLKITLNSHGKNITFKVRKPEWCEKTFTNEKGEYLIFTGVFNDQTIEIEFPLVLRKVYANPLVQANTGKVVLSYGPLVLCAEGIDNAFPLQTAHIGSIENAVLLKNEDSRYAISAKIPVSVSVPTDELYTFTQHKTKEETLTLIPYFAWANRGETDMQIWFPQE